MIARKKNKPQETQSPEAPAGNIVLDTVDVVANKATGEKYAYYDNLTKEEKRLFSQDSPIGRFIRSKAMRGKGLDASEVADFATALPKAALNAIGQTTAIPQAAMVEALAYATGKPANLANALPNYDSFNTSQRTPSEVFMSPDASPIAKLAVDIVADPSNVAGGFGLLKGAKVMNSLSKAASSAVSKAAKKFDEVAFGITDDLVESPVKAQVKTINDISAAELVKNFDPEKPLSNIVEDSTGKFHFLAEDGTIYEDVEKRIDIFSPPGYEQNIPPFVEIDGKKFELNEYINLEDEGDVDIARFQAAYANQFNERLNNFNMNDIDISIDETLNNIPDHSYTLDAVKNFDELKKKGISKQTTNDADRFLITFYQQSGGAASTNTKRRDAYPGLADYLKSKMNEVILKQPKSTVESKVYTGRRGDTDYVELYNEDGSKVEGINNFKVINDLEPGDIFSTETILSTSTSKKGAFGWNSTLMGIRLPKGTSTLSITGARNIKKTEDAGMISEFEQALYSDARFRVIKNEMRSWKGGTKRYLEVELINPKVLIPAFVTLKLNQSQDESEE